MQQFGDSYDEVFVPDAKYTILRVLFAINVHQSLYYLKVDSKSAILNVFLDESVYMHQTPGKAEGNRIITVCLDREIYELKQSSYTFWSFSHLLLWDLSLYVLKQGMWTQCQ